MDGDPLVRILVTGMTSQQTKEDSFVAGSLAIALRALGHDVTVEKPSLRDSLDSKTWDHVFVGLGPLHGIGTSSMYGALGVIGAHWSDKLTLYLDDVDAGKIGSGFRIMEKTPAKLTKPWYTYKREWELAKLPEVHGWLMNVIDHIINAERDFPSIIVPAFDFDSAFATAQQVSRGAGSHAVDIDFSAFVPKLADKLPPLDEDELGPLKGKDFWATPWEPSGPPIAKMGELRWDVVQSPSQRMGEQYARKASGMLIPAIGWHHLFAQAASAKIPVATNWRVHAKGLGEEYEILPQDVEIMTKDERDHLARLQHTRFWNRAPEQSDIQATIARVMKGSRR